MKLSGAFLLIIISAIVLFAQKPAEFHQNLIKTIEKRDYKGAMAELERLRAADKHVFTLNNYDYLLARLAERIENVSVAAANYQSVVNRNSLLKEYALRRLAHLARSSGNLLLERTYLQEALANAPDSLAAEAMRTRLARSLFESRNFDSAIAAFLKLQTDIAAQKTSGTSVPGENSPRFRENMVFLAEAYLQSGKTAEAREVFLKLINSLPNPSQPDDFALAGAQGLDRLEAAADYGTKAPPLTDLNHLQRAAIYHFNRDFSDARLHYQAIVANHPQSGLVSDALFQIGRGFAQEMDYVDAIDWFERVITQFPESPAAKDALLQSASAFARVNKPADALERYRRFIEKYPTAENLDRAYLNMIDVLRDGGDDTEALKWSAKTQEVFRGKLPEALALFSQLRIRASQTDWQNVVFDAERLLVLPDLGGTRVPGGTNKNEVTFLKAFALENQNRFREALDTYLLLTDGRGEYYGWRATERLRALAANERAKPFIKTRIEELTRNIDVRNAEAQRKAAQDVLRLDATPETQTRMLEIVRRAYTTLPDYQKVPGFKLLEFGRRDVVSENPPVSENRNKAIADELLFLGLYDEATPELERAEAGNAAAGSQDFKYTLATFYKRGDMAHRAVGFIEPLWRNVPADFQIELIPRDHAELLYPAPYVDSMLKSATPRGVDPRYVLSIMRQESRYRADVKSNAAARGLMQFISTTSNQIARELKLENFRQDELYHPPTAVLFGSQYLSNLYKMFPAGHQAVAASYNGGEENVKRWLQRSKSDNPDIYVPEIVFSQSKDYAYKVLANFRVYQHFYDQNLVPR